MGMKYMFSAITTTKLYLDRYFATYRLSLNAAMDLGSMY